MPGDKSITHRALIFSALTTGKSRITGALGALDCLSTVSCLRRLGLIIEPAANDTGWRKINTSGRLDLVVKSKGPKNLDFRESTKSGPLLLDAGNSGTTMRIMSGLLAGLPGNFALSGDDSLSKRDMRRVLDPLATMGASVTYRRNEGKAPFIVGGGDLKGGHFELPMASAQVETALLVAGLLARGKTTVKTPARVRDHTLKAFLHLGIPFHNEDLTTSVEPLDKEIEAKDFTVPGDISSAAFFLVAAAIMPGSSIVIPAVGTNSGRGLVVDVLRRMGVSITYSNERLVNFEPVCDIEVSAPAELAATEVGADEVPLGIDELPVLALAFALARGRSKVSGAAELKEKESNRLTAICKNLANQGVKVEELSDGFIIDGSGTLSGGGQWQTLTGNSGRLVGCV